MKKHKSISVKIPLTPELAKLLGFSVQEIEIEQIKSVLLNIESIKQKDTLLQLEKLQAERNANKALPKLKNDIKTLIAQNQIQEAIEMLMSKLESHSLTYDSIILISAKFHRTNEHKHLQIITFNELDLAMSKIANAIIYMVNNIDEEEIK